MLGGPLLWLRCDGGFGASREIGERESEVAWGWLGTSWAREKTRWLGVLGVARWLGTVKRREHSEKKREQRLSRDSRGRRTRVLENGLRKKFP